MTLRITEPAGLLLEAYHYSVGSVEPLAAHVHTRWQIGWSPNATGEHLAHGRRHRTAPGEFSLIAPGQVHAPSETRWVDRPASFVMLFVDPDVLVRVAADEGLGRNWQHRVQGIASTHDRGLSRLYRRAVALSLAPNAEPLALDEAWQAFLQRLVTQHAARQSRRAPAAREPRAVALARELLHAEPARAWSLDELAAATGLSSSRLRHAFRATVGMPPHAYAIRLRIDGARAQLAAGVAPIDVAARGGFADQSHLGRHFRRIVGVTPGQFQAMTATKGAAISF